MRTSRPASPSGPRTASRSAPSASRSRPSPFSRSTRRAGSICTPRSPSTCHGSRSGRRRGRSPSTTSSRTPRDCRPAGTSPARACTSCGRSASRRSASPPEPGSTTRTPATRRWAWSWKPLRGNRGGSSYEKGSSNHSTWRRPTRSPRRRAGARAPPATCRRSTTVPGTRAWGWFPLRGSRARPRTGRSARRRRTCARTSGCCCRAAIPCSPDRASPSWSSPPPRIPRRRARSTATG